MLCADQFEDSLKKGIGAGYPHCSGRGQSCRRQNIARLGSYHCGFDKINIQNEKSGLISSKFLQHVLGLGNRDNKLWFFF
jgi:hypothetical protein